MALGQLALDHELLETFVIDSFAWIEYFAGSSSGAKARPFIESGKGITPTIVLAEISEKYRKVALPFAPDLDYIIAKSRIVPLDAAIAEKAGYLSYDRKQTVKRWGLSDSVILATAREHNGRVVTGDEHFRDLGAEAVMIQ